MQSNNGYPYGLLYYAVPIKIVLTLIWFLLPLRITFLRSYVGIVPIVSWLIFFAEYMCYERALWILPPGGIILFISCFLYGNMLCGSWMASSASFICGMVYFTVRTGTKLSLVSLTLAELCLSMGFLIVFAVWMFYFNDFKSRIDFLDLYDKIEVTKFGKYFMEQIPIATMICSDEQILFANQEIKAMFNIEGIMFPVYNTDNTTSHQLSSFLFNLRNESTGDTFSASLKKCNYAVEGIFTNQINYYKILSKNTNYGNKICQIYCILDITKQRQLEIIRFTKQLQTSFMATMSHELRTPINGIMGAIKELREKLANNEYDTQISTLDTCTTILLYKVNDMLDFAQNETTSIKMQPKQTNLRTLFNEAYNTLQIMATSKKIKFNLQLSEDIPTYLSIDDKRLNQILYNIIGNAIKYTFIGKIDVRCECRDSIAKIEVADTGIGIKHENQKYIGELFVEKTNKSSGMGLGLHISYILVKAMNGKIAFTSKEGEGSIFTLLIPYSPERESQKELRIKDKYVTTEICCPKVLIVDDNNFNLLVLENILKKFNVTCGKAMNGKEAIEAIAKSQTRDCCSPYELILMDCNMPILDGYQATEQLLKSIDSKEIKPLKIVGVTAFTSTEHLENCISSGMSMALCKPIRAEEIKLVLVKFGIII